MLTRMTAELKAVTKRYGQGEPALKAVDLAIGPGELVALLGPNGAGKTTAIKLLLGLIRPTSGTVQVFGRDPYDQEARVRIGAMLQVAKVPETLKVREHVQLFRSYYPRPLAYTDVIDAAGLAGLENRQFGDLSGGQRQRVLFALALCGNPDLLFLDEPTVGLDPEARHQLWARVQAFVQRGGSVLLTTHYLEEADALAQRVIMLQQGRITADGTPSAVKARVVGHVVRCQTTLTEAELQTMPGVQRVTILPSRVELLTSEPDQLVRALLLRDAKLAQLEVIASGLNEVYTSMMEKESLGVSA